MEKTYLGMEFIPVDETVYIKTENGKVYETDKYFDVDWESEYYASKEEAEKYAYIIICHEIIDGKLNDEPEYFVPCSFEYAEDDLAFELGHYKVFKTATEAYLS